MGRRVAVTGVGLVTPLGIDCKSTWENLIKARSGIRRITRFPVDQWPESLSKIAGEVSYASSGEENGFRPEKLFRNPKDHKKTERFMWYGFQATEEALEDAGWKPTAELDLERTGVVFGSGVGGLEPIQFTSMAISEGGTRRISPFFVPQSLINLVAGHISIRYGFRGPNLAFSTACATGSHCIGEGMEIVKRGDADVLVAGSTEAPLCILGVGGFSNMHALSTRFNNEPTKASRPWDRDRDGFVIAEGAGVLILEEYQHARRRGAKVYGEVAGYGASGDAYHITAPDNLGRGAKKSMRMALEKAQLEAEAIDYVNAHGTSTLVGDNLEFNAVQETLGKNNPRLLMSSTKSSIGHMLGAAGAVEAVFLAKILEQDIIPPTINLDHIDENCRGIDLVPHTAREKRVNCVMSNSFGFGGTNATLILRKFL